MGLFDEWKKRNRKSDNASFEYYEDTHDESGNYLGARPADSKERVLAEDYQGQVFNDIHKSAANAGGSSGVSGAKIPDASQSVAPRNYQNVVVYKPTTPEDVQTLIDFLKRREPAIVNLDDMDAATSQRILDFVSGAIYALSGSVHRIAGNIFLLSPEGVEITVPLKEF